MRLRYPTTNDKPFHDLLAMVPEIIEAHHVTGEDCFILKVVARSMRHLEQTTGRISGLGPVTTTVVYSSPLKSRPITADTLGPRRSSPVRPGAAAPHRPGTSR